MKAVNKADTHPHINEESRKKVEKVQWTWTQLLAAVTISLCSLITGFTGSYSAPAIPSMKEPGNKFNVTEDQESLIGSLMPLSAIFGSIIGGPLITNFGRKMTIFFLGPPFVFSFALIAFAFNITIVYIGRAVGGLCVGLATLSLPIYLGETLQPEIRGKFGILPTTLGNFGLLLAYIFGALVNWSTLAIIGAILPLPYFILMFFIPESPVFLITKNKKEKAEKALIWLRADKKEVSKELAELQLTQATSDREPITCKELKARKYILPLSISLGLMLFQQFSGINAVIYYTVTIFKDAGSTINENLASIIVGLVNLGASLAATFLIDKLGRKVLMYISLGVMTLTLATLGTYFHFIRLGYNMAKYGWLPCVACVLYVIGFSIGSGPIPWLMMGEILPSKIRGPAASIATTFNWICAFFMTWSFHKIKAAIGYDATYWCFGGICFVGLIFIVLCVPETRGKRLDDIERYFRGEKGPIRDSQRHSSLANMNPLPSVII